jgi:hypothetical protein
MGYWRAVILRARFLSPTTDLEVGGDVHVSGVWRPHRGRDKKFMGIRRPVEWLFGSVGDLCHRLKGSLVNISSQERAAE